MSKKPTYKEINGATRVGDALRWLAKQGKNFAPELLQVAGSVTGISSLNLTGCTRGINGRTYYNQIS